MDLPLPRGGCSRHGSVPPAHFSKASATSLWTFSPLGHGNLLKAVPAIVLLTAASESQAKDGADDPSGDGNGNHEEPGDDHDSDEDGVANSRDGDIDGDGIPNRSDSTPRGR